MQEIDPLSASYQTASVLDIQADDRPRYVVCAVESPGVEEERAPNGGFDVDTRAVSGKLIQFCKLTPVLGYDEYAQSFKVPEGRTIRAKTSMDGLDSAYRIYAGPELASLVERYGPWGLEEVKHSEIQFQPVVDVLNLGINQKILTTKALSPDLLLSLPGKDSVEDNVKENVRIWSEREPKNAKLYKAVETAVLSSLRKADRYYRDRLEMTHRGFEVQKGDERWKAVYDDLDALALRRTGVEARHSAIDRLNAEKRTLNVTVASPEGKTDDVVLETLQAQNAALKAILQKLNPETLDGLSGGDDKSHPAKAGRPASGKTS